MLSVNKEAHGLVKKLLNEPERYNISIKKTNTGTILIDAGLHVRGGFAAGRIITEICMGGLGEARIFPRSYGNFELSSIFIQTDHPAIATLGSQFAGWQIKKDKFFAIGSGPARALALKPREIFTEIDYEDKADVGVLVLETAKEPPEALVEQLSAECKLSPSQLIVVLVPTASLAGSIQVSGRIVETGLHKLSKMGLDPLSVLYAWGYAPIAPVHPKFVEAMGRTNDVILYGGVACYTLRHNDDAELRRLLQKAPSSASKHYGKPFKEIFEEAEFDFYKIDPGLFAPAMFTVNNVVTGSTFQVGKIDAKVLGRALSLVHA